MELLAEAYDLLRRILGFTEDEVAEVFALWTGGVLGSVLLDATTDILRLKDDDGEPLVLKILDRAGQKGVGKAAVVEALEHGASLSVTTQAVFSRCLSTLKMERSRASRLFSGPEMGAFSGDRQAFVDDLEQTLYASKIVSYAQVFKLLAATNETNKWGFKYRSIAHIWRGGCLIAGNILTLIVDAYTRAPQKSLILDDFFRQALQKAQPAWRRTVSHAVLRGVPIPAFSAALAFFDGYRSAVLPANLIQAQREYFGAHGLDVPRREHEINWRAYGNALVRFWNVRICTPLPLSLPGQLTVNLTIARALSLPFRFPLLRCLYELMFAKNLTIPTGTRVYASAVIHYFIRNNSTRKITRIQLIKGFAPNKTVSPDTDPQNTY